LNLDPFEGAHARLGLVLKRGTRAFMHSVIVVATECPLKEELRLHQADAVVHPTLLLVTTDILPFDIVE